MFTIDGVEYRVKCTATRGAEIRESDISGLLLNGQILRDVLGTYFTYDIQLEMPLKNKGRYASLIEQLTEPVDGHLFVLPYNNSTLELTGKAEDVEDVWKQLPSGYTYWDGLKFTIEPNGPTKTMTLEEAIQRGLTPLPDVYDAEIGDTYTFTENGWEPIAPSGTIIEALSVTENGRYTAPAGRAYSPVNVNVSGGGGGGGASVLLNDFEYATASGSASVSYSETVNITEGGNYIINLCGALDSASVYINGTEQSMDVHIGSFYTYGYSHIVTLSAGDTVTLNAESTGRYMLLAQVIKTA